MFLVVGLGNPGSDYKNTRHNIGFMAVDELFCRYNFSSWKKKFNAEIADGLIDGEKVLLLKPQTFMNLSGEAVLAAMSFYKIPLKNIIVIHDEMDCPVGKIKAKIGGGAGGHNGLKNIDLHCGQNYSRLRIGINKPVHKEATVNWVLGHFPKEEKEIIQKIIDEVVEYFPVAFTKGVSEITSKIALGQQKKKG